LQPTSAVEYLATGENMGQLINFYAGDAEAVGRAFAGHDCHTLRDPQRFPLQVDFSLHLSPIDLDLLTEEVQKLVGSGPTSLSDSLGNRVGGDGEESAAEVVSPDWVGMMAAVPDASVESLITEWTRAVAEEHSEPELKPTDDMRHALRDLLTLCREAHRQALPVVHTWSL
jgi:hypothetical protein